MSLFQDRVYEVLKIIYPGARIFKEVPVKKLFPEYQHPKDRFDIVINNLNLIVECHGIQHIKPVTFSGTQEKEVYSNLVKIKSRDTRKENMAVKNKWIYIVIWYDEINNTDNDINIVKEKIWRELKQCQDT